jgi:glutaredoxin 3
MKELNMNITIYSIDHCPYCESAKALLRDKGIAFAEIKVNRNNPDEVSALVAKSKMKTFPQIFNEDTLIGGYTELAALDKAGKLS